MGTCISAPKNATFHHHRKPFKNLPKIEPGKHEHVIVLMMENRSFDTLMGYLYSSEEMQTNPNVSDFRGVSMCESEFWNPIPEYARKGNPEIPDRIHVHKGLEDIHGPDPDPGEYYPRTITQLYGVVEPEENRFADERDMKAPYNAPEGLEDKEPNMKGFVEDYINNYHSAFYGDSGSYNDIPPYETYKQIMQCFSPETVPVLSTLAREFGVCDNWFCSVPSQTFPNRSFWNACTSKGKVVNEPFWWWALNNDGETIFEQLEKGGYTWRVYYDASEILPVTLLIHFKRLIKYCHNFHSMTTFYKDLKHGTLPNYVFIEPRLIMRYNSMHPPVRWSGLLLYPSSLLSGDKLIHKVYRHVRKSKLREKTMLMIIFDENGGTYDHVPPPKTVPPDEKSKLNGEMGCTFTRLGARVPAVIVSPWVERNTICHEELEHSSFAKYMRKNFDLQHLGPLSERDAHVNSIPDSLFTRKTPRTLDDYPQTVPRREKIDLIHDIERHLMHPLGSLGHAIVFGWAHLFTKFHGDREYTEEEATEIADLLETMKKKKSRELTGHDAKNILLGVKRHMKLLSHVHYDVHDCQEHVEDSDDSAPPQRNQNDGAASESRENGSRV
mmetsp:Transcript_1574/g.5421  ORF Transcript_1574/g.5421 Transcript_1574/m.5421 type:complete len:610 (-) Transcript_1574:2428-4257(-)|eukprot:CAMPEP_0117438486 /NCGR_PEP_ID=MMETSP0759-20121206/2078_1 /TAXON_ID=63605 /ORGANISM="Percolomonas cosmopolitus, Strain WS" /LENGTH=609 /DNA_ID=CAMNT_0005230179 /DNA_START=151 /DNA_END=1980 /DNA_ORIENTATION=+